MTRTSVIALLCLLWKLYFASAFNLKSQPTSPLHTLIRATTQNYPLQDTAQRAPTFGFDNIDATHHRRNILSIGVPTLSLLTSATAACAADEIEVAELPPVYIPILFALVCLGGVGFLTSSLGDVISEEASLGNLSGARAKKEQERSRSSYFKK